MWRLASQLNWLQRDYGVKHGGDRRELTKGGLVKGGFAIRRRNRVY